MSRLLESLPLLKSVCPADQSELSEAIVAAHGSRTPVYPLGGSTSLDFGLPARTPGLGLEIGSLKRVIDYPARDMTITVEAGITIQTLSEILASERQEFPVDVPQAEHATLGGVIATNFNGLRRYGCGAIRDHVIGIRAVDGRGIAFNGGGRVVKNVAGYDFCKLLTGSLGTLGVITQVTLKVRPIAEQRTTVVGYPQSLQQAESALAALESEPWSPVAIELLGGPAAVVAPLDIARRLALVLVLEGTTAEVDWSVQQARELLAHQGLVGIESPVPQQDELWAHLREFPAHGAAPLVARGAIVPSGITPFISSVWELDADCSIQAHAGTGTFVLHFSQIPSGGLSRTFVGRLQAEAAKFHGHLGLLSNPGQVEITRQSTWGAPPAPLSLMTKVKQQFDPANILNPGRFVFA